jgi:nucleoside triphosphate diphosphatase
VSSAAGNGGRLHDLLAIMQRLRAPDGCAWDREQNFSTIAPYTIEEAHEVADAIERGEMADLKDELGDLLFQVVFHAQMASEAGLFDFEKVADAICQKLIRRHPHVFGGRSGLSAAQQRAAWEDIKADERRGKAEEGHLAGVPSAMPALLRAYKLSKRAARAGFDFEHSDQTADKVAEELAEVREAVAARAVAARAVAAKAVAARAVAATAAAAPPSQGVHGSASPEIFEEIGDLLFAVANLARKLDVDAEAALRAANLKFERRFRAMESLALARGEVFENLDLAAQERLWQAVKRGE